MLQLPDLEIVAERVHESWMKGKQAQGVTSRLSETGEELMVPYHQLSEPAKELDRATVRTVYAAIESLS
jgi:16S rRNA G527 N7-methylase RsmG